MLISEQADATGETISAQVSLAVGWRDAWRHELRGPHGEWIRSPGEPLAPSSRIAVLRVNKSIPQDLRDTLRQAQTALSRGDEPEAVNHLIDVANDGRLDDSSRSEVRAIMRAISGPATRPGGLRDLVEAHLRTHPGGAFTPYQIGKELGRSSGAVANSLETLVRRGVAERTGDKPRTYRLKAGETPAAVMPAPAPPPAPSKPPASELAQEIDRLRGKLPNPNRWADAHLAADGGPGVAMMSHNATVRQIGHLLAGELDRRVQARLTPSREEWGRVGVLEGKARTAFSTYSRQHDQAEDEAARKQGFASYAALVGAYRGTHDGSPEEAHLMSVMGDVNKSTDKATAPALAKWTKLKQQLADAHLGLVDTVHRTRTIRREETVKLLQEVRGDTFGGDVLTFQGRNRYTEVPSKPNPQALKAMRFAETNYPQGWLEHARQYTGKAGVSVVYPVPRGDYTDSRQMIRLSDGPSVLDGDPGSGRVATHEMGHLMEQAVPGLLQLEQAEIWRRTSRGEVGHRLIDSPQPMHGYTGEYARADRFPLPYSGKDYSRGGLGADSYELFTTGVESLFMGSPYLDPPFRAWMLGAMATLGRDAPKAGG